jgi:hypothetical protein
MQGIHFIVDEKGRKRAVVIDLKKYGALWGDFRDSLLVRQRAGEPRESLAAVKRRLRRAGTLNG